MGIGERMFNSPVALRYRISCIVYLPRILLYLILAFNVAAAPTLAQTHDAAEGVRYYRAGDYAQAADALGRAVGADSSAVELYPPLVASLFQLERHAEARRLADAGLRRQPDHALLNLLRADLFLMEEEPREALRSLQRIYRFASQDDDEALPDGIDPADIRTRIGNLHLHIGFAEGEAGDWQAAAARFRSAREFTPNDPQVHRSLAYAYLQTQQWDAVVEAAEAGLQRFPDDDGLTRLHLHALAEKGDASALLEQTEPRYRRNPGDLELGMTHAQALLANARYAEAQEVFDDLLERFPADRRLYEALIRIHRSMMNPIGLLDVLDRMQAAFPEDADVPYRIAAVHESRGDYDAARSVYDSLAVAYPNDVEPLLGMAATFEAEDDFERAIKAYTRILDVAPEHTDAHLRLGDLLERTQRWARARDVYERLLEMGGQDVHIQLGRVNLEMGDVDVARRNFEAALDRGSRHPLAPLSLARIELDDGEEALAFHYAERAIKAYTRILDVAPEHTDAHLRLGDLLERTQRWARARDVYERLLEMGGQDVHIQLGRVNLEMGDVDVARRNFEAALDRGSRHPLAPLSLARIELDDGEEALAFHYAERALHVSLEAVERAQRSLMAHVAQGTGSRFDGLDADRRRETDALERLDAIATEAFAFFSTSFPQERTDPVFAGLADQYGGSGRLLFLIGGHHAAQGDETAAMEHFQRAIRFTPGLRDAHVALAELHERRGDPDQAMRSWERALSLDDAASDAYRALIRLSRETGREDDLIRRWSARLRANPGHETLRRHLIEALHKAGRAVEELP